MPIICKRYSVGVLLLALLSLVLSGCSDIAGAPKVAQIPAATKTISGFVSYTDTGLPLPGATVTAYAIDASGVQSGTPLPGSSFAISDVDGSYSLKIPASYTGSLMLEASVPARVTAKAATPHLAGAGGSAANGIHIRSLVPATAIVLVLPPPVMLSLATEAVVVFLEQNVTPTSAAAGFTATGFSSDNIRKATIVMETIFGPNFSQVPPPASDAGLQGSNQGEVNLVVLIQAVNSITTGASGTPLSQLVAELTSTGLGSLAASLNAAVVQVVTVTLAGALPPSYQMSPAITAGITGSSAPVTVPDLTDSTPPTVPASLAATAVDAHNIRLSWGASSDSGSGVAGYTLYRSDSSGSWALLQTLGPNATGYLDSGVLAATQYQYQVAAFDGARNSSAFSSVATATTPAASTTPVPPSTPAPHNLTGTISAGGAPVSGVLLVIAGAGTGRAVSAGDGSYAFHVLNGSYLVTPVLAGYQFSPATRTVTVNDADLSGQDFSATLDGTAVGTVTYPSGSATGNVTYPDGSVTSVVSYPNGTVIGGVNYPPGTVITSVTYPNGVVIAGVSYPAGTVIATVSFPSGTVVGGVSYPNGSVTSIVSYPSGSVVGGVGYPSGLIVTRVAIPTGAVVGGVSYPAGTVFSRVTYPTGTVIGGVSYPAGTLVTSITLPTGAVLGGVSYPAGSVVATVTSPSGTVATVVSYPNGSVSSTVSYPDGALVGGVSYPAGSVVSTVSYPNGTLSVSVSYPSGAVVGGVSYPAGSVVSTVSYPNGTISVSVSYPSGVVLGGVSYPAGTVTSTVTYPDGIVVGTSSYPPGTVVSSVLLPDGSVTSSVTLPDGSAITGGLSFSLTR